MFNLDLVNPDLTKGCAHWIYVSLSTKANPAIVKEVMERLHCLKNVMICTYDKNKKYDQTALLVIATCIVIPPAPEIGEGRLQKHKVGRGVYSEIEYFRSHSIPVYVFAEIGEGILVNEIQDYYQLPKTTDWNEWGIIIVKRTETDLINYGFADTDLYSNSTYLTVPTDVMQKENEEPRVHMALLKKFFS